MTECVEDLTTPPVVGQTYIVPCVLGSLAYIRPARATAQWWPVLRPSHQDSRYAIQTRTIWRDGEEVEEEFWEDDPSTPHHYHVDPRFAPAELYSPTERELGSWHNTIDIQSEVEFREMECVREMPIQVLYRQLGRRFVEDHRDKALKCGRCPHKGTNLASMPIVDGVVTCPTHGLKFDAGSGRCLTA